MITESHDTIQQILPVYTKSFSGSNNEKFLKSWRRIRGSHLYHLSML